MNGHGTSAAPGSDLNYDQDRPMASLTWTCPNCKRRVPSRVDACHCGTTRSQAEQLTAASPSGAGPDAAFGYEGPAVREELGWDVKGPALGLVLVAVFAAGWLIFRPYRPDPIAPVLGFVDKPRTPPPTTIPRRPVPPTLFKLPWWK
jgi:hypothetical protein